MPSPIANPPNPWASTRTTYGDDELDMPPPPAKLEIYEERSRTILSANDSPDLPFRYSINPYRGCFHGCAYCYARPSHQYWDFGAGTDFERKLIVRVNAVELLREAFAKPSWRGDVIVFSGNTDCYQPIESSYRLTRQLLEVCLEHRQPVAIITKSSLIRRDVALLAELAKVAHVRVTISAAMPNDELGRAIEPYASPIHRRFEVMRLLRDQGIEVGISLAPIIPGLNDDVVGHVLKRAKEHGASFAFMSLVRLSREVLPVFEERIAEVLPGRAARIRHAIREMRGGAMNDARFGSRMSGEGERWKTIEALFHAQARRLGLAQAEVVGRELRETTFAKPKRQLTLFDG